ncbi:Chromatin assembly factor 1 subunit [Elasticomyces elasticus]|nr:Chromatin assembly factor 1 subunit [Elasticomyces elasticus]KAK3658311.1 Chromatin assembly factor 1 subunit [Elasticomyces elasticus]KAK4922929.1 Chromatin assembly factor 1 subunit [Elasticomyces elasticus]KAK5745211.1 Chromatin assembly factor 1 subunit [Elasticomyces elasticus]
MKAAPLLVAWHNDNAAIYSAHFEPHGKGRLATAGGDNNVRIWQIDSTGEDRKVTYLSTLVKHSQAVNVVRWCPRGEMLASAGDDGNVILWIPSDNPALQNFGEEQREDIEHWRQKTAMYAGNIEIYDLAWSPDGQFLITGSTDNIARIYNQQGTCVRQIAEHNNYVQGVAWDPLNEFVATQSSDRSVHIYALKSKDGSMALAQHNKVTKMDLPGRRISSNSPAPPDFGNGHRASFVQEALAEAIGSPRPSAPGTPQSLALPMNPPPTSHSRKSSFGSQMGQSGRQRSVSPSPSMPLPAVMPSASPSLSGGLGLGARNTNVYHNESLTSFFRRLTFTPDGSLLFTPAGQYKTTRPIGLDGAKVPDDIINTVYIYTRGGLNKPPVAYLPGHKKPSIAVKCSPIYYNLRNVSTDTKEITIDTRTDDDIPSLPGPAMPTKPTPSHSTMEPPPFPSAPSPSPSAATMASPRHVSDTDSTAPPPSGPVPAFGLPYRIVYAVATQDAVHLYDTQQQRPLCIVSNLHYATFTDLSWTSDGLTLLMTSSDGFCSALTFAAGELGTVYHAPTASTPRQTPQPISITKANSAASTPQATPTAATAPLSAPFPPASLPRQPSVQRETPTAAPSPSPYNTSAPRPVSPARSMSTSSIATDVSFARFVPDQNAPPVMNNPTPSMTSLPSVAAAGSAAGLPLFTPPQTPGVTINGSASNVVAGVKRPSDASEAAVEEGREKKRRIAPTLVEGSNGTG